MPYVPDAGSGDLITRGLFDCVMRGADLAVIPVPVRLYAPSQHLVTIGACGSEGHDRA